MACCGGRRRSAAARVKRVGTGQHGQSRESSSPDFAGAAGGPAHAVGMSGPASCPPASALPARSAPAGGILAFAPVCHARVTARSHRPSSVRNSLAAQMGSMRHIASLL
jgi:hypothetical protein